MNLGGPGWFRDVCEVAIELHSSRSVQMPEYWGQESCQVFDTASHLRGTVTVTPPAGHRMWHGGVTVTLMSSVTFYESFRALETTVTTVSLADAGYMGEVTALPLDIDLSQFESLFATYQGTHFRMRHMVTATVVRPWYTFDVVASQHVALYRVALAPAGGDPEGAPPHVLEITDCHGLCSFDFKRACYNMHESLTGTVRFRGVQTPITRVELLLVVLESGDGVSHDSVRDERVLFQSGTSMIAQGDVPDEALGENLAFQPQPPFQGDGVLTVSYPFDKVYHPSVLSLDVRSEDDAEQPDVVDVRYFVRLRLTNVDGDTFWNTSEVWLYCDDMREAPVPPRPPTADDDEADYIAPPPAPTTSEGEASAADAV